MSVLYEIAKLKYVEVQTQKNILKIDDMIKDIEKISVYNKFQDIFETKKFCVIGEIKRSSPSKGIINKDLNPVHVANLYKNNNFFAVSVLTERNFFLGDDNDIIKIKEKVDIPILRKDFIIDEYQIYHSKYIQSDAILLITKLLDENKLKQYIHIANAINLVSLVEVEDEREIEIALNANAKLIGINNRNLNDLNIDIKKTERLMKYIPKDIKVISESGITNRESFMYIKSIGVNGCLIGTAFSKDFSFIDTVGGLLN
ncbi:indole-3-glycerol phosphate synthase TrpC [Caldicellulosiruptoraceae bacterium PP1]